MSITRMYCWHRRTITGLLLVLGILTACGGKSANQMSKANPAGTAAVNTTAVTSVNDLHMARDDGKGNPGEETDHFGPEDRTIHCVAELKEAKPGSSIRFSWVIVEAQGAKDEKLEESDYSTKPGEEVVHGQVTLPKDWPPGKYKVDVFVNGKLDKTIQFTVE